MEPFVFSCLSPFVKLDVQRVARTDLEGAIVLKVNVEVGNVHALLRTENATRMFVGIVGSGEFVIVVFIFCFTTFYHSLGKKTKALMRNGFRASALGCCLLVEDLSLLSIQFNSIHVTETDHANLYACTHVNCTNQITIAT